MSSINEGFSSSPEVTIVVMVGNVNLDRGSGASSGQAFFEGEGLIAMDSDRRLCYLSQNPTLKSEAIFSSSFSFSQIIEGTGQSTPAFGSSL